MYKANTFAKEALSLSQMAMKPWYDHSDMARSFQIGKKVLALPPMLGSALSAKFALWDSRTSEWYNVISSPEKRRKTIMCHVNILKRYFSIADLISRHACLFSEPALLSFSTILMFKMLRPLNNIIIVLIKCVKSMGQMRMDETGSRIFTVEWFSDPQP